MRSSKKVSVSKKNDSIWLYLTHDADLTKKGVELINDYNDKHTEKVSSTFFYEVLKRYKFIKNINN